MFGLTTLLNIGPGRAAGSTCSAASRPVHPRGPCHEGRPHARRDGCHGDPCGSLRDTRRAWILPLRWGENCRTLTSAAMGRELPDIEHRLAAQLLRSHLIRHRDGSAPGSGAQESCAWSSIRRSIRPVTVRSVRTGSVRQADPFPGRCCPPGRTGRTVSICSLECDECGVDVAWVPPQRESWETHFAPAAGGPPSSPDISAVEADYVARTTWARRATRVVPQATRSNIQRRTCCLRPRAASAPLPTTSTLRGGSRASRMRLVNDISDPD